MSDHAIPEGLLSAAQRAELPYILFPNDIALRLQVDPDEADLAMRRGLLGPWLLVHGRPAILRDAFKENLRARILQLREADRELLPGGPAGRLSRLPGDAEDGL